MIFNCPECNAGHSVPVSMIPNGGLDMDCRRCGEAFTIEPPTGGHELEDPSDEELIEDDELSDAGDDQGEKTSVGPPPLMEATRVGVANPLQFDEAPLIGPGGIQYRSGSYHERPTVPIPADQVPLSPDEQGLDPELDETIRFNQSRDDTPAAPSVTEPGMIEPVENSDVSGELSGLEVRPLMGFDSSQSVYERVAAGIPVPEEHQETRPPSEPRRDVIEKPRSLFQPVIDLLNRAPLALKVGLIVFPVTLGVMLVINSMREEEAPGGAPIEIPVAAEEPPPAGEEPPPAKRLEKSEPKEEPAEQPPREVDDAPAPEGFAYVQVEEARLRVRPLEKSGIAGRVPMGGLVKVYDELGGFSLVANLPEGPAGFLSKKLLGPRKPLALLARDQAFQRCSADEEHTVDDCLFSAKQQEQACLDRCGAVNAGNEAERLRCAEVCNIAFDSCAGSCRDEEPKLGKGKRRRR